MPTERALPYDADGEVVRILAGADVLTVIETITGASSTTQAPLRAVVRAVQQWAEDADFFAAAVLVNSEQPGSVLVYSQRLLPGVDPPIDVAEHWRIPSGVEVDTRLAEIYFVSLTRQGPGSPTRMQYLGKADQAVTVAHHAISRQRDIDERGLARRHLGLGGIRSVAFHLPPHHGSGLEIVVWEDPAALAAARKRHRGTRSSITGDRFLVHAVVTRASAGRVAS